MLHAMVHAATTMFTFVDQGFMSRVVCNVCVGGGFPLMFSTQKVHPLVLSVYFW